MYLDTCFQNTINEIHSIGTSCDGYIRLNRGYWNLLWWYMRYFRCISRVNHSVHLGIGVLVWSINKDSYELLSLKHCIYLKTSKNVILDRLKDDNSRPLLNVQNKDEVIEEIMLKREQKYEALCKSEVLTDNQTIQDNCNQILEIISVQ